MAGKTIIEIPEAVQAAMLKELRCARYGFLLTIHIHRKFAGIVIRSGVRPTDLLWLPGAPEPSRPASPRGPAIN
jgi:hypothetical protein